MKKEYLAPAIDVKVVLAEQILAASESLEVDQSGSSSDGEAKPSFSIWEYIESKE